MQKTLDLKHTLNLPQTHFSMKANLPQNEPRWLAKWAKEDLYGQIRAARKDEPIFTLTMDLLMPTAAFTWGWRSIRF